MLTAWVVLGITVVLVLLAFRLGFALGAANPDNGFVDFIYDTTGPLAAPFDGIAADRSVEGGGVFEPETPVAMGVYLVAAILLVALFWAVAATPAPSRGHRANREAHQH